MQVTDLPLGMTTTTANGTVVMNWPYTLLLVMMLVALVVMIYFAASAKNPNDKVKCWTVVAILVFTYINMLAEYLGLVEKGWNFKIKWLYILLMCAAIALIMYLESQNKAKDPLKVAWPLVKKDALERLGLPQYKGAGTMAKLPIMRVINYESESKMSEIYIYLMYVQSHAGRRKLFWACDSISLFPVYIRFDPEIKDVIKEMSKIIGRPVDLDITLMEKDLATVSKEDDDDDVQNVSKE